MSSNLKVNTILPSVGSNIGIGTNGGELNVDGGCKVQVGTALTLGHSIGLQYATQNLHSTGFEVNQINASGIVTATSFVGDGSNLTGLTVPGGGTGLDLNDGVKLRLGTGNDIEFHHTSGGNIINYINGNLIIKKGSNSNSNSIQFDGNGHMYVPDDDSVYFGGSGDLNISHRSSDESAVIKNFNDTGFLRLLSGDSNSSGILLKNRDDDVTYLRAKNEQGVELYYANTKQCETSANGLTFPSGKGIDFSATSDASGTITSEVLDDYEEGSYSPTLTGSGGGSFALNPHALRYTKVGRVVHVSGRLYIYSSSGLSGSEVRMSLPYTNSSAISSNDAHSYSYVTTHNAYNPNSDYQMVFSVLPGNAYGVFLWVVPNAAWQSVSPTSHMNQNAAYYGFDFTYTTAS